jgi:hypothetical protein
MDDIIKSAREIAMEKVAKLGTATDEERLSWKYIPLGEELAAKFYKKDDTNLVKELSQYPDAAKKYVARGAAEVFIRNIDIPKNDATKKRNKKTMDGLKLLKNDKVGLENIFSKFRYLFTHYEEQGAQQRQQAYQGLKAEMEEKVIKALQQQMGGASAMNNINVEKQPEFQQEWRKIQAQMDAAYTVHLNEYKKELSAIS